jgi:predicted regulator of Ras-like GTPase activity (Roadblock/LC7/MglB family)
MASRSELITSALEQLIANNSADISGAAVISSDGMLLGSRMGADVNADRVGAIAATMMGVTTRVVNDLKIGKAQEAIIHADSGYLVVVPVNAQIVLAIILRPGANLGLIRLEARDTGLLVATALSSAQQPAMSVN